MPTPLNPGATMHLGALSVRLAVEDLDVSLEGPDGNPTLIDQHR